MFRFTSDSIVGGVGRHGGNRKTAMQSTRLS